MTTGKRIHDRRKELGLSVQELADRLGKNRATVYRYESDYIETVPAKVLEDIAEALETTPVFLLGLTDDPYDYDTDPDSVLSDVPDALRREWQDQGLTTREIAQRYAEMQRYTAEDWGITKPTPDTESGSIGPNKRALLDDVMDCDEATAKLILDVIRSVKSLGGE